MKRLFVLATVLVLLALTVSSVSANIVFEPPRPTSVTSDDVPSANNVITNPPIIPGVAPSDVIINPPTVPGAAHDGTVTIQESGTIKGEVVIPSGGVTVMGDPIIKGEVVIPA
jgi:hypothetical protein